MPDQLPRIKWPRAFPICTLGGIAVALLLTAATAFIQIHFMPPLQRFYVLPFLKASVLPMRQDLRLIEVYSRIPQHGYVMAADPWISFTREHNQIHVALTEQGAAAGLSSPRLYTATGIKPQTIRPFFEHSIYGGSFPKAFRPTLFAFALLLATGIVIGGWHDQRHQEAARRGVQIRGPRMMNPRKAKKYLKGDGIALFLEPKTR